MYEVRTDPFRWRDGPRKTLLLYRKRTIRTIDGLGWDKNGRTEGRTGPDWKLAKRSQQARWTKKKRKSILHWYISTFLASVPLFGHDVGKDRKRKGGNANFILQRPCLQYTTKASFGTGSIRSPAPTCVQRRHKQIWLVKWQDEHKGKKGQRGEKRPMVGGCMAFKQAWRSEIASSQSVFLPMRLQLRSLMSKKGHL